MGDESQPVSAPTGAVFLSYASQDAQAARRICDALSAAGIEVWFDQSGLRGGDVWDQTIRKQIKSCALFVPVISQHTHERAEGYFRLEWKLAVDRCHLMAADKAFLVPVVIDDTPNDDERVPERFREIQWTRLPEGNARPDFVTRIQHLLSGESGRSLTLTSASAAVPAGRLSGKKTVWLVVTVVLATLAAYLITEQPWTAKPAPTSKAAAPTDTPVAFNPLPHSVAVLPFVNMSGDKEQEYFSDGLTEELLNSLSRIGELQVAGRTSSFYFKGKDVDLGTIAHKLNVAAVLEGSVRRSERTVRITAQLVNAVTGFHMWSQTYDRDLGDVLQLQTEIATAVATSLKVTLLGDVGARIEVGGTRNPAAFDAYLRGSKPLSSTVGDAAGLRAAIVAFTDAIRLDPNYALAFADRALARSRYVAEYGANSAAVRADIDQARIDARNAITLAPALPEGYRALGYLESSTLHYAKGGEAYERAIALAPGNARMLPEYSRFAASTGRTDAGIAAGRRCVVLDPLNSNCHFSLGTALRCARRYAEAVAAFDGALALEPDNARLLGSRGLAYYGLGNLQAARSSCETKPGHWVTQWCLAVVYDKLGRHADAEAVLAKMQAANGRTAYQNSAIYAQWGNHLKALEWLETALRTSDAGLIFLKTDPLMDPVREEPRFQAVMRELKFPD
jgi:TolB-like protein/tetratricopeptide (TPR) repeat protein